MTNPISSATQPASLGARYFVAQTSALPMPLAEGKRLPFGWRAVEIGEKPLILRWPDLPALPALAGSAPVALRVCVALDTRDEIVIEVALPATGRVIGRLDVRYASPFQLHELELPPADVAEIARQGVELRLTKGAPLAIFSDGPDLPDALKPHLMVPDPQADKMAEFARRLGSLASVQRFGWMEGCVLDGLLDWSEISSHEALRATAQRHLDLYLRGSDLIYEDARSNISDNRIYGIEGTLPFAAIARLHPRHPVLELPVQFWLKKQQKDGAILDGQTLTSEGAYTIAYPMAVIARARGDAALRQLALTQLRVRFAQLFDGQNFGRTLNGKGERGNVNWARGIAWQLLGSARTLGALENLEDASDVVASFGEMARWALQSQRADGLWSVFVDEPDLAPDTSGSAGIAAALAIGARRGWLDETAHESATRALLGLQSHLKPDGFLGGVAQENRGGEALQRGDYRVMHGMGMGLMAQLIAALSSEMAK